MNLLSIRLEVRFTLERLRAKSEPGDTASKAVETTPSVREGACRDDKAPLTFGGPSVRPPGRDSS